LHLAALPFFFPSLPLPFLFPSPLFRFLSPSLSPLSSICFVRFLCDRHPIRRPCIIRSLSPAHTYPLLHARILTKHNCNSPFDVGGVLQRRSRLQPFVLSRRPFTFSRLANRLRYPATTYPAKTPCHARSSSLLFFYFHLLSTSTE
jgi:hypothetical protein